MSIYFSGNRTNIKRKTISNFIEAEDNGKKIIFSYQTNTIAIAVDYSKSDVQDLWSKGTIYCHGLDRYKKKNDIEQAGIEDKLLYHSSKNGMEIHLFMAEKYNEYRYCGILMLSERPYQERIEDETGKEWFEWVFPMIPVSGVTFWIPEKYRIGCNSVSEIKTVSSQEKQVTIKKIKEVIKESAKKNDEEYSDYRMLQDIGNVDGLNFNFGFQYNAKPKMKQKPKIVDGCKIFIRDKQTTINALTYACYECEIDSTHPTFIRRNSNKKYTEPHHLVPMAFSELFEVSLDIEENIVSLCSNCHNQIHYGRDAEELLVKLYEEREEFLVSVGIVITIEQLLEMYGIHY